MVPGEVFEEFEIDPAPIWPEEDDRLEPFFYAGPLWIEFDETEPLDPVLAQGAPDTPLLVEFEEVSLLDPELIEEADEPLPAPPPPTSRLGLFGSVGIHLLILIIFLQWSSAPAEVSGAVPVQLVIEQSSVAPEESSPGELISENMSEVPPKPEAGAATPSPEPPRKVPQAEATPPVPPKPNPPPAPVRKQPTTLASPRPAPTSVATPPQEPRPNASRREARGPAPGSGRGDYFNYLVTLTRSHFDVLPLSFLGGRSGRTILSVTVFEDGTIGPVAVKYSSGYSDIDARIVQMVTAVGHFPPLPEGIKRPSVELDFNLAFPDALQH